MVKKAHFIGIAGIGMSAVAVMLKDLGVDVTGSDEAVYPPASTYLSEAGIPVTMGYNPANIPPDTELIVLGRNAKLSPEVNDEVKAALKSGKDCKSFAEVLGELTQDKRALVVAGSYGKSTCTALAAWCLVHAGRDPSYFVGAESPSLSRTASVGKSDLFILEGDEYPTSHTDERSKFAHFHTHDLLLTAAVHDHVNVFPTPELYQERFIELVKTVPADGIIVASVGDETERVIGEAGRSAIWYSALDTTADWHAVDVTLGEVTTFSIVRGGQKIAELETTLLGVHNIENIVGIAALLIETKILTIAEVQAAVREFKGVRRRLDNVAPDSLVPVLEGFGSSYEKAKAAIDAVREHFTTRRLVIVFEPHTFGWRNKANIGWYDTIFDGAGAVFIAPPEGQGAATHEQLGHDEILSRVQSHMPSTTDFDLNEQGGEKITAAIEPNDVVLILTSGGMGGLTQSLPKMISNKFPKHA